jgi:NAD+ diphosphatase
LQHVKIIYQIMHPLDKFKFCPVCGSNRFGINNFKSKKCADCGFTYYMNPSAATVALILNKQGELLAVRRKNEPARGTLDMPGGFSDAKETSEQGVIREVMEETGLSITNLRYFGSQPWPYPCGLMVGFEADYDSGTPHLQREELLNGGWFHRDHLPQLPEKLSIARQLIDHWLNSPVASSTSGQ